MNFALSAAGQAMGRRGAVYFGAVAAAALFLWEIAAPRLAVRFEPTVASVLGARAAMAVWAAAGLAATGLFLARTEGVRAGVYAAAVLATMPAWFVHGRTATGAMVPMAAAAMVLAGLVVAVLDARAGRALRIAAAAVAVMGTVAGAASRGAFVVAAPAAMAVGFVAILSRRGASRAGIAVLVLGVGLFAAAAIVGVMQMDGAVARAIAGPLAAQAGQAGQTGQAARLVRFDAAVAVTAYALVPWSPLVPLALARCSATPAGTRPVSDVQLATALTAALGIAAYTWLLPRNGASMLVVFGPVAASMALSLRALDAIEKPSAVIVAMIAAVALLVARDIEGSPERVLDAIGSAEDSIGAAARNAGALSFAAATAKTARAATIMVAVIACAILLVPRPWLPVRRGLAIVIAGGLAGLALRVHAYPALLARLSPGEAWETWTRVHATGEALGTLGVDPHTIPHAEAVPLVGAEAAARWLTEPRATRRYVALGSGELARFNALFRTEQHVNVPILAGGDGTVMLAASALGRGERSENPLDAVVVAEPPGGLRTIGAVAGERLDVLGWDLRDAVGRPIDAARQGKRVHARLVLRVRPGAASEPMGAHCTFLHIDHSPTRFAAEHRDHAYPMSLWRAGDVIVDDFEITLPPHFRAGRYAMWWGIGVLPCEDDRRMPVTSGPSDGHGRIRGGMLEVQ